MKLRNQKLRYNLQMFADGDTGPGEGDNSGDGDDNQDDNPDDDLDESNDDSKSDEKTFTQEEVDAIVEKRLARAKKKQGVKGEKKADPEPKDKNDKGLDESKLTALEEKVLCYDADISKDYVKEAMALAKAYVDEDTDMEEALEKVVKKFPWFVKGYEDDGQKAWGQRQKKEPKKPKTLEEEITNKLYGK